LPNAALLATAILRQFALPGCQHVAEPGERRHEELPYCHSAALSCCLFARKPRCQVFVMPRCWQVNSFGIPHCHIASKRHGWVSGTMQNCHIAFLLTLQTAALPQSWVAALLAIVPALA